MLHYSYYYYSLLVIYVNTYKHLHHDESVNGHLMLYAKNKHEMI